MSGLCFTYAVLMTTGPQCSEYVRPEESESLPFCSRLYCAAALGWRSSNSFPRLRFIFGFIIAPKFTVG